MQIYFHSHLCSYLPRVPILVEDTVYIYINVYFIYICQLPCMQITIQSLLKIYFTLRKEGSE